MTASEWKQLRARHQAFWRGEGEKPLKRTTDFVPLEERGRIPLSDGTRAKEGQAIVPEMIEPARFYAGNGPRSAAYGDFLAGESPPALCWTEAILGCPVRVVTGGAWADAFLKDRAGVDRLEPDAHWLEKLDAFVDFLVRRADGRYPVVQPLMRGPVDMAASALGHERLCVALLETPEAADAFLSYCADLFIRIAKRRLARTPRFEGGYVSSYGIWAPGPVVRTQVDNATMLSPAVYRERVLPHDRRVIEAFAFPLIHLHSGCLHVVDDLLEVEPLKAIQVSIDYPGGPLTSEVMPVFRRVIERKPLIVTGPVTEAELAELETLSPGGRLCLQVQVIRE